MFDDFDMLAATLAHEIKNPLALVRANLDYIELCDTEKRHTSSCAAMKLQLERTTCLIQDFVGFVSGAGDEKSSADINASINRAAADYTMIPEFEIETELPPEIIVSGNERLLVIVFSNAIKNSMEAGAQRVRIQVKPKENHVCITIADNGKGLSEEALANLGEGTGYTSKKYGNGLGVLISRRIITGSGGTYSIENAAENGGELGLGLGGCVVTIELPYSDFD